MEEIVKERVKIEKEKRNELDQVLINPSQRIIFQSLKVHFHLRKIKKKMRKISSPNKDGKTTKDLSLLPQKKYLLQIPVDRALKSMFGEDATQTNLDVQENESNDCFEKSMTCKMTSFSSEAKSKLESKDSPLENVKESSSMPPPSAPVKHVPEKDETISEKEQEPLPPPPPPPPLAPASSVPQSPAPVTSPLNMISPQSVSSQHSPCIIDDELMDEALMGSRK
ncbi:hypothetical protein Anas_02069 [Armadillidium nasatum]|uniref:Uncharacterized protein n=1 Tax=Armadillidium nasatum TaxID=96803 RepID=A0A5N5THM4_9CRUS|nr:hypothetical protein Anas_02069 [Armadillidium nasatum]